MSEKNNQATKKRTAEDKLAVLEQLKKLPIIQAACQKAGISRASFYRWKIDDKEFAKDADDAIAEGVEMINDLSENQLIMAIRDNNLSAVRFWLQNRHKAYANKVEVMERGNVNQELNAEQKKIVEEALRLASLGNEKYDN
ncbi:MAG: hypothetical protein COX30_03230 [Candidatus Moranbacteria bacterium CG23_combo_of_CG06-09_8_20_14_all_39_10]|nr:MAG: hypothetical protein COX30_03230 [Candidatus Moranbacteria bacterium CG23_combo_of_CG06-09_8_20_14_all_39_10]